MYPKVKKTHQIIPLESHMKIGWLLASQVSLKYFTKNALSLSVLSSDKYLGILAKGSGSLLFKYLQSIVCSRHMDNLQGTPLWKSLNFFLSFFCLRTSTDGEDQPLFVVTNCAHKHKSDSQFALNEDPWACLLIATNPIGHSEPLWGQLGC